ncbi:hypothetical protein C0Q70_08454 [Pomacea canaliculata]|uniref:Uncharacterized protein n=1 Tax=Pomacea canaliculata TaxID=400727 RepID=A0A2T7PHV5_POMCA|nr:hypothetical protein C0Q70_08454 [Pomacea canaliculata]
MYVGLSKHVVTIVDIDDNQHVALASQGKDRRQLTSMVAYEHIKPFRENINVPNNNVQHSVDYSNDGVVLVSGEGSLKIQQEPQGAAGNADKQKAVVSALSLLAEAASRELFFSHACEESGRGCQRKKKENLKGMQCPAEGNFLKVKTDFMKQLGWSFSYKITMETNILESPEGEAAALNPTPIPPTTIQTPPNCGKEEERAQLQREVQSLFNELYEHQCQKNQIIGQPGIPQCPINTEHHSVNPGQHRQRFTWSNLDVNKSRAVRRLRCSPQPELVFTFNCVQAMKKLVSRSNLAELQGSDVKQTALSIKGTIISHYNVVTGQRITTALLCVALGV